MSPLGTYKKKRVLDKTPEPKARVKKSPNALIFVVQKHHASHLHYDLRLELDGVLKSWAVPKGPPKTPDEKRLAIMVEDHPYDYKDFSGTIPKGHYGAGEVMIWDSGTYSVPDAMSVAEAEKKMRAMLKKGHLSLLFHGKKLKGEYSLIRTALPGTKEQWLWLKKGPKKESTSKEKRPDPWPLDPKPMLAGHTDKPFNKKDWLFEIKWDGYRCLAVIKAKKVALLSRNLKSFNEQFPRIAKDLLALEKHKAILDGEIVVLNAEGRSDFQLMQNAQSKAGDLYFFVFDLLYCDGVDLRARPLIERKEQLETLLAPLKKTHIRYSDHVMEKGVDFFKEAKKLGLEGIVAKDAQSAYVMKRSNSWLKIKAQKRQEVVVGGFTAPRGSRTALGALLIGVYDEKKLQYIGHVGTGFSSDSLKMLEKKLSALITAKNPFSTEPKTNAPATFVKPVLVCEVSFTEWTKDGSLRHPVFLGLRVDKKAKDVVRE